ncbi:MAG: hypothetical protein GY851_22515 [bacterium]|nr:hypothetical protein [bacterium]
MRIHWITTCALAALMAMSFALAEAEEPRGGGGLAQQVKQADANGDGTVTFEEASAAFPGVSQAQFDSHDKNGDGVVSMADAGQAAKAPKADAPRGGGELAQRVKQADADGDGKVTFEEASAAFPGVTQAQFGAYDKNGDGIVSMADGAQGPKPAKKSKSGEGVQFGDGILFGEDAKPALGAKPGRGPKGGEGARKGQGRQMFKRADANGDKKVSFEELSAVAPKMTKELFARFDANGDGVLTEGEGPKGRPGRPGPKGAGRPGPGGDMLAKLKQADANGDNQVSYEELASVAPNMTKQRFVHLDTNGDGVLSDADGPKPGPPSAGKSGPRNEMLDRIKEADTDEDGKVTFEEAVAAFPGLTQEGFNKFDINNDGILSAVDVPEGPPAGPPAGAPSGPPEQRGRLAVLRKADTNGDTKVTFEELNALMPNVTRERFDAFDKDGDGVLTPGDGPKGRSARGDGADRMARIRRADGNGDGKVTLEEIRAQKPEFPEAAFKRMDRNSDGVLSEADHPGK